jgi:hypothetical protein
MRTDVQTVDGFDEASWIVYVVAWEFVNQMRTPDTFVDTDVDVVLTIAHLLQKMMDKGQKIKIKRK